jgi:hypothetical protein
VARQNVAAGAGEGTGCVYQRSASGIGTQIFLRGSGIQTSAPYEGTGSLFLLLNQRYEIWAMRSRSFDEHLILR